MQGSDFRGMRCACARMSAATGTITFKRVPSTWTWTMRRRTPTRTLARPNLIQYMVICFSIFNAAHIPHPLVKINSMQAPAGSW